MRTAAYARYSSDNQREASLDDQLRNVRSYCSARGWPEPAVYQDAAMSGARNDRPGYLRLLADAQRFDVILVDDLSRLSRDSVEAQRQVKRLKFAGVRVIAVSDGIDTDDRGHKLGVGLKGLMSELYLDDLRDKTHRGLAGRALSGASAGGLPYGYTAPSVGQRAVCEAQAAVVRRIYADYVRGQSARAIAKALNREGVPSPRGGTWAVSAIHGDVRRGIGILGNPIYCGRQVWNRSRWVKHPDTGRRLRKERPESEWIITEHPELVIVDAATFDAAAKRLRRCAGKKGRPVRYLLSGILRCADCGGPLVVVDRYRYGCATAKDRGTCKSSLQVARIPAEKAILRSICDELLSEKAFQAAQKAVRAALKAQAPDVTGLRRNVAQAAQERENLVAALRAGVITPSTRQALLAAEARESEAIDALKAAQSYQPAQMVPRLREVWRRIVATLSESARNVPAAREAIRELVGERIVVRREAQGIVAEIADCQIAMVAGAGFEPATFGL